MPTKEKTLNDLFLDTLKDIYHAEKQILRALSKMSKSAQSPELKQAFEKHREETDGQVERLEQVFEILGKRAQAKPCEAIRGILEEGHEIMDEYKGTDALDAGLLAAAQAVEHYEMARYGTLKAWAMKLGMQNAADLLNETLEEEKRTDALLTELAEGSVNAEAGEGETEDEGEHESLKAEELDQPEEEPEKTAPKKRAPSKAKAKA